MCQTGNSEQDSKKANTEKEACNTYHLSFPKYFCSLVILTSERNSSLPTFFLYLKLGSSLEFGPSNCWPDVSTWLTKGA